jgi:hypothetical protein
MGSILYYISFSAATECTEGLKFLNIIHFTSVGFKLVVYCWKVALWCRTQVTIVISCTVCAFIWYSKWRYAWHVTEWFISAWDLIFNIEKWKSFPKMSIYNRFTTLSKQSLHPLPIPDDGASNFCRNVWNLFHFALAFSLRTSLY